MLAWESSNKPDKMRRRAGGAIVDEQRTERNEGPPDQRLKGRSDGSIGWKKYRNERSGARVIVPFSYYFFHGAQETRLRICSRD